jgi:hypothetical protein
LTVFLDVYLLATKGANYQASFDAKLAAWAENPNPKCCYWGPVTGLGNQVLSEALTGFARVITYYKSGKMCSGGGLAVPNCKSDAGAPDFMTGITQG